MQTVQFSCSHCGKLMAVGDNLRGMQVRCPHCQQVVVAPAPAPPPPAVPFSEQESIFDPTSSDSALFGEAPRPVIEMPIEQLSLPEVQSPEPTHQSTLADDADLHVPTRNVEATVVYSPDANAHALEATVQIDRPVSGASPASPPSSWSAPTEMLSVADGGPLINSGALSTPLPQPAPASNLWIILVLIPLISYAILATVAVLLLYFRPSPPDPLEQMLDLEGDFQGAKKQGSISYERIRPDVALPAKLRVALNHSLRIGDLEVTPRKVELRRAVFHNPGFNPEKGADDSLILYLRLRNVSTDTIFSPTDPFFERRWKAAQGETNKPYSFLEIGQRRFYGGPVRWDRRQPAEARETIAGQQHKRLAPGEELMTFVCTDPDDHVRRSLDDYRGPLLWRIQLRRGLVLVRERSVSTTAVVGVEFRDSDVEIPPT